MGQATGGKRGRQAYMRLLEQHIVFTLLILDAMRGIIPAFLRHSGCSCESSPIPLST